MRLERVAPGRFDRILRPRRPAAFRNVRYRDHVAEAISIATGNNLPGDHFFFEDGELFDQDRGLERVRVADVDVLSYCVSPLP